MKPRPSWSPDGKWIAFASNHVADPDRDPGGQVYIAEAKAGAAEKMLTPLDARRRRPWRTCRNGATTENGSPSCRAKSKSGAPIARSIWRSSPPTAPRRPRWSKLRSISIAASPIRAGATMINRSSPPSPTTCLSRSGFPISGGRRRCLFQEADHARPAPHRRRLRGGRFPAATRSTTKFTPWQHAASSTSSRIRTTP